MPHTTRNLLARLVLALAIVTLILGCSCTKPRLGTLSGTIQLVNDSGNPANDPIDFSGISISLYEPAVLDTAILRANQTYPGIGFAISQETEFDHREYPASYSATTDEDGGFNIKGIEPGKYNIVLEKPGWGWRYLFDCQIGEGTNSLGDMGSIKTSKAIALYPERYISGTCQLPEGLISGHTYIVSSEATITNQLIIHGGAVLLLDQGVNLTAIGGLSFIDVESAPFTRISVNGTVLNEDTLFGKIQVHGEADITSLMFDHSISGIQFVSGNVAVSQVRFKNSVSGLTFDNCDEVMFSNSVISDIGLLNTSGNNLYTTQGGADFSSCQNVVVENSIFIRNHVGVKVREYCVAEVKNGYFVNNTIGIEGSHNPVNINHNMLQANYTYDIRVYGTSSPLITKNECFSSRGVNIGLDTLPANLNCTPAINFNNFQSDVFAIRIMGNNMIDVDATNNYFHTTNLERLEEIIWDQNDYDPNDWSNQIIGNTAYLIYIPFSNSSIPDAGIW